MRNPILLIALYLSVMIWSGWAPHDRFTWVLEVMPAWIGLAVVAFTWKRFPLSTPVLWLLLLHVSVLCVGGRYTYAEVPLFDWIRDITDGTRNNYDKVGHFMQGFVPAFVAREILIRRRVVTSRAWLGFLVATICISISVTYEWIEWGGIFAPAGTPAPILDRMNAVARDALALPATQDRLRQIGMVPVGSSRAEFSKYVTEQRELLGRLTREANVTLD